MKNQTFDQTGIDVQATPAEPVSPDAFDYEAYADYEASLLDRCSRFWQAESGVLVNRRMRIAEVFSYGCKDIKASLEWQLGGLEKSMKYKADVPNFLTPWYGIGTVASAFGADYIWKENQSPAIRPKFSSVKDALDYTPQAVSQTRIGKHTLDMIDYFLDRTGGRVPMSLTDTQSPLNIAGNIVEMTSFFIEMLDNPQAVKNLLNRLAELLVEFTHEQIKHIGNALARPGHGYSSCRSFEGLGMSDDNALMISSQQYLELAAGAVERAGKPFGGPTFHSCGDFSDKVEMVKKIAGLRMVDGAFSAATDPSPNPQLPFAEAFANTGIIVNARIVGGLEIIAESIRRLWKPGMKLIVVTFCQSPQEQAKAYDLVYEICGQPKPA
ncbi:MAG: uroporphyrinogen decarboxylase family protein [Planctomycetota bacterium]